MRGIEIECVLCSLMDEALARERERKAKAMKMRSSRYVFFLLSQSSMPCVCAATHDLGGHLL